MRTVQIEIGSKTYPLCYSLAVVRNTEEKYGSMEELFSSMTSQENTAEASEKPAAISNVQLMPVFSAVIWLLHQLLEAGSRYSAMDNSEIIPIPGETLLMDMLSPEDMPYIQKKLLEAMEKGQTRNVEVIPPKNEEAAPAMP